ncbi:MAG: hypothetical protein AAGJ40_06370 [Planctomycetota bacterium]
MTNVCKLIQTSRCEADDLADGDFWSLASSRIGMSDDQVRAFHWLMLFSKRPMAPMPKGDTDFHHGQTHGLTI